MCRGVGTVATTGLNVMRWATIVEANKTLAVRFGPAQQCTCCKSPPPVVACAYAQSSDAGKQCKGPPIDSPHVIAIIDYEVWSVRVDEGNAELLEDAMLSLKLQTLVSCPNFDQEQIADSSIRVMVVVGSACVRTITICF
jgi:hypothetical protein